MAKPEKGKHFKQFKRYMEVIWKVAEVKKLELASLYYPKKIRNLVPQTM